MVGDGDGAGGYGGGVSGPVEPESTFDATAAPELP
jgi:hypothetical protein